MGMQRDSYAHASQCKDDHATLGSAVEGLLLDDAGIAGAKRYCSPHIAVSFSFIAGGPKRLAHRRSSSSG